MTKKEDIIGTGRRKTAVASVRLREGSGKVNVNGKEFDTYFPTEVQRKKVMAPLKEVKREESFDLIIRIKGGGLEAQAEAARLGLSRALVKDDEECRGTLKSLGYLRRDPRMKERKKYGLAGARKKFQFSKR